MFKAASRIFSKAKEVFTRSEILDQKAYWEGRGKGWRACEDMVIARIKKNYPDKYKEMLENLLL